MPVKRSVLTSGAPLRTLLEKERQETREEGTKKEERGREKRRNRRRGTREVFEYRKKN